MNGAALRRKMRVGIGRIISSRAEMTAGDPHGLNELKSRAQYRLTPLHNAAMTKLNRSIARPRKRARSPSRDPASSSKWDYRVKFPNCGL